MTYYSPTDLIIHVLMFPVADTASTCTYLYLSLYLSPFTFVPVKNH